MSFLYDLLRTCRLGVNWQAGVLAILMPVVAMADGPVVKWVCSTARQPWNRMPSPVLVASNPATPPHIRIAPERRFQTIDGFGGCFNELGWVALSRASTSDCARVLSGLFGDDGCAFTMARIPIGASDFALDGYSLDETPGDLELKHFSIARDRKHLIPFVKAAIAARPGLRCWGSAWSPPAWMKTNSHYSRGSIRWEPAILRSYATYLARWVEAYREEGIDVFAVFTQNEPNILSAYPTCLWSGSQLREFVADYLGPTLRDRKTEVELWLGTLNGDPPNGGDNVNDRLVTVLDDPKASAFITGISFQYDSRNLMGDASRLYPEKKLMQSETECNNGANSWGDAQRLYGLMKRYLENGANSYFAWNMVLDETGMSTWKWRQNALVTVDRSSGQVTFNGEYYVMRHFSQFVKPGARRVLTTGMWGDKIAFQNKDGSLVAVVGNSAHTPLQIMLTVAGHPGGNMLTAVLPADSVSTFVIESGER